jgi:hypothetical protein
MPTLTIDLSDAEYAAAIALPETERRHAIIAAANRYAVARNESPEEDEGYDPPTQEDLDAIGRGLEDEAAGRVEDGWAMLTELREQRRAGTGAFAGRGRK